MTRVAIIPIATTVLVAALAGCPAPDEPPDLILITTTAAPPAHEGRIVNDDDLGYRIEMSRGVAIAAQCWNSCDWECKNPRITSTTEGILEVRPIYRLGNPDAVDYAIVAVAAGGTVLDVTTQCARRTYLVEVTPE